MKIMKRLIYLFISFLSLQAMSQDYIYTVDNRLPHEMKLIIDYLQKQTLTFSEKLNLDSNINAIDYITQKLDFQESFFIIKSEIYKNILKHRPEKIKNPNIYNKQNVIIFENFIKEQKDLDPFVSWILNNIKDDFVRLTNQTAYQAYIMQKTSSVEIQDNAILMFERRMNFILPFVDYFLSTKKTEWDRLIKVIALSTLERITTYGLYQLRYSRPDYTPPTNLENRELVFFTKKPIVQPTIAPTVSAEQIVEETIAKEQENIPAPSASSDWVPRDDLLFPTPDPNYVPPEKLPNPVSDWDEFL